MEIVVVTKVPEAGKESGNLAMAGFDLRWATGKKGDDYLDKTIPFLDALTEMLGDGRQAGGFLLNLRQPVFALGEILFLDGSGREFTGAGRKPSKWFIEVETVSTIEEAITLSLSVTKAEEAKHD